MKGTLLSVVVACAMALAWQAVAGEHTPAKPINPPYGMARGFGNMMSGWLEIPRGVMYENARIPVVGFVVGPVKGAFLTTWREVAGVTDVMCMGLTGKGLYNETVPDFVWDAHWLPQRQEYRATAGMPPKQPRHIAPPRSHTPCASPCHQHAPARPPVATPCDQARNTVVMEEVKLIEWTAAPTSTVTAASAAQPAAVPQAASQGAAAVASSPVVPRRKVRVSIPFDLGPADHMDQRMKAIDERVSTIEKRAGIWQ